MSIYDDNLLERHEKMINGARQHVEKEASKHTPDHVRHKFAFWRRLIDYAKRGLGMSDEVADAGDEAATLTMKGEDLGMGASNPSVLRTDTGVGEVNRVLDDVEPTSSPSLLREGTDREEAAQLMDNLGQGGQAADDVDIGDVGISGVNVPGGQAADDAGEAVQEGTEEAVEEGTEEAAEEGAEGLGTGTAVGIGAGGLGLGAAGGYGMGYDQGQASGEENKNLAFGAGLATGAVTPQVTRRAYDMYKNQ